MRGFVHWGNNSQAIGHLDARIVVAIHVRKVITRRFNAHVPLLFLLIANAAFAQTASDFSARYGYPEVERFVVRPGITVMASYAGDRSACEMVIEPKRSIPRRAVDEQSMSADAASQIIDELIPRSERGILLDHAIENMGASELQVAIYQNVTISRYYSRNLPANQDLTSATVVRKDSACISVRAPREFIPVIELHASDLHARYGDPDTEKFVVRPGITLMILYGADQVACQMVVEPARSIIPHAGPELYMRPDAVTEIIDEILPEADRGKLLLSRVTKSGCNDYESIEYPKVTVSRFRHNCRLPSPEVEGTATITRTNPSCVSDGK